MKSSFIDYSMSVITGRALPDCKDGLKPVHRRILYVMHESGNTSNKVPKKAARMVGETMGKYHPHGDSAIYMATVRLAQPFSLMEVLIEGQGNFGSIDGDPPAHMRYTEVRTSKFTDEALLQDLYANTVEFQDNYDASEKEPKVLPVRFPNLLLNGASGIAVGMATNIPTHNLGEIVDVCCACLDNPDITVDQALQYIPGPDFPTGGELIGRDSINRAMRTGHGGIILRGKASIKSDDKTCDSIIITEIPYQVNKSELIREIEALARDKVIDGISEVRDESNKLGISVIINLKRSAHPEVILNQLYRHTQLEISFGVNMIALCNGQPKSMNFLEIIKFFLEFRQEVVTKKISFLLNRARERAHILVCLLIAISHIDEIITLIKQSSSTTEAKAKLMDRAWDVTSASEIIAAVQDSKNKIDGNKMRFTETQAQAILDMRLQKLTGLEEKKILEEVTALQAEITLHLEILQSRAKLLNLIREELLEIKLKFAKPRKTLIIQSSTDFEDEDLIPKDDMVVTITREGYIKRTPLLSYRQQKRGGRGRNAMSTQDGDTVSRLIIATTHHTLLFFSNLGQVYKLKVYQLPQGEPTSKGRALVNLISLGDSEKPTSVIAIDNNEFEKQEEEQFLVFTTKRGKAKRNSLRDFSKIPTKGKIAIQLEEQDELIGVALCKAQDHIMLATKFGKAIRFEVDSIRHFIGRTAIGVSALKLSVDDAIVALLILKGVDSSSEARELYLKNIEAHKRIAGSKKVKRAFAQTGSINEELRTELMQECVCPNGLDPKIFIDLLHGEEFVLSVTSSGLAKITSSYDYRVTGRNGVGVSNGDVKAKGCEIVAVFSICDTDSIMIITNKGTMIRLAVKGIRITGRTAIGVKVIELQKDEFVTSVSKVVESERESGNIEDEMLNMYT